VTSTELVRANSTFTNSTIFFRKWSLHYGAENPNLGRDGKPVVKVPVLLLGTGEHRPYGDNRRERRRSKCQERRDTSLSQSDSLHLTIARQQRARTYWNHSSRRPPVVMNVARKQQAPINEVHGIVSPADSR
jgi:hypothetical protein